MTNTLKIAPLKRIYLKAGKFSLITDQNREEINIATELKAKIIICKRIKIITSSNKEKVFINKNKVKIGGNNTWKITDKIMLTSTQINQMIVI